jgi:uncharacterized protein (TIGR02246 family)
LKPRLIQDAIMNADEAAIRAVVESWLQATRAGDVDKVLALMSDDVIFMVPGAEPFGKKAFEEAAQKHAGARREISGEIRELKVLGDWAYLRNHLEVAMRTPGGETSRRSGYTLTILRKQSDGRWLLTRDANLLASDE